MKRAVIDIGSNSVRLLIDGANKLRYKNTTRLGEGMTFNKKLKEERIYETFLAVRTFFELAEKYEVERNNIYAFATAAVRNAENGNDFVALCKNHNININVISGKEESELALLGALKGKDGAVLDVGGASSELAVANNGKIDYFYSLKVGAVLLKDLCGEDRAKLEEKIALLITEYKKDIGTKKLYGVGGTASAIAHSFFGGEFDRNRNNGFEVSREMLSGMVDSYFSLSPSERNEKYNIGKKRTEIICGGALLILRILDYLSIDSFIVSEDDNLEGYLLKLDGYEYKQTTI